MSVTSLFSKDELIQMLRDDKEFRDAFVLEFVRNSIPNQLRAIREERGWTQDDLGRAAKKRRNVITRLENANSHLPNLASLYDIAVGCKAALLIKIIPFSRLLKEMNAPFSEDFAPAIDSSSEKEALDEWIKFSHSDIEQPDKRVGNRAELVVVGGNPKKSADQRAFRFGTLHLAASNPVTSHNIAKNTKNDKILRTQAEGIK